MIFTLVFSITLLAGGFSSVTYALWIVTSTSTRKYDIYHLAGLVIIASIVAHSSTDVLAARWFCEEEEKG